MTSKNLANKDDDKPEPKPPPPAKPNNPLEKKSADPPYEKADAPKGGQETRGGK